MLYEKGSLDGSATIDKITEKHMTLGNWKEKKICGICSALLYKTVNVPLLLAIYVHYLVSVLLYIILSLSQGQKQSSLYFTI